MSECKHGLKVGCSYCHRPPKEAAKRAVDKKRPRGGSLAEKMNERMTALGRRLRELRSGDGSES